MWILIKLASLVIIFLFFIKIFCNTELRIKVLKKIINYCKKSIAKNYQEKKKEEILINDETYNILTPVIIEDSLYLNLLEEAVETPEVKNIALTGSYGSGKSSIIKSFIQKNSIYNTISISLLNFLECNEEENKEKDKEGTKEKRKENEYRETLEKNIFQQIFFSVHAVKIPLSRFKRIRKITTVSIFFIGLAITSFLVNIFLISEKEILEKSYKTTYWIVLLGVSAFNLSLIFLKLKKLNFKFLESDIELSSLYNNEDEKNILNEYLDEIIYCLNASETDIIIIEDLDRFESQKIFLNLREINLMLNNSKEIQKKITFIYAIKDDLFSNEERTKFFDFIIPVIPILNSNNSEGYLGSKLNEYFSGSKEFLEALFFHISDMRLGLNIINEFKIYKKILENKKEKTEKNNDEFKINNEKLLGLIVYKNLFPSEFASLTFSEGELYEIFNNRKKKIVEEFISRIDEEISEKKNMIKKTEKEILFSIDELKIFYVNLIIRYYQLWNYPRFRKENKVEYSFSDLEKKNFMISLFDGVKKERNLEVYSSYYGYFQNLEIKIEDVENKFYIAKNNNYEIRKMNVELKSQDEINRLNKEIEKLNERKMNLQNISLKNLLSEKLNDKEKQKLILDNVEDLSLKEEKYYNLKLYLLTHGIIDERYYFYISYFYEGALTEKDQKFISYVMSKRSGGEGFSLDNPEAVLKHIKTEDSIYILNYDLLKYSEDNDNYIYLKMIRLIGNYFELIFNIMENYLQRSDVQKSRFIQNLIEVNPEIWKLILENLTEIDKYIVLFINSLSIKKLLNIDEVSEGKFIESVKNFANILNFEIDIDKLKKLKTEKEIKIKKIIYLTGGNIETAKFILEEEMYKINLENIKTLHKTLFNSDIKEEKILKELKEKENLQKIWDYILENKEEFLREVYFKINNHSQEDEEGFIEIVNDINAESEVIEELLNNMSVIRITDIEELNEDLWDIFFEKMKIKNNFKNLKNYVEIKNQGKYLEGKIFAYLELNISYFQEDTITEDEKIFEELMEDKIEMEFFEKILKVFKIKEVTTLEFRESSIYKEKIKYFIKEKILKFTEDNFKIVYELFEETEELKSFILNKVEENITEEEDIEIKANVIVEAFEKKYENIINLVIKNQEKISLLNSIFKNIVEGSKAQKYEIFEIFSDSYDKLKNIFQDNLEIYKENFKEVYLEDIKLWKDAILKEKNLIFSNKDLLIDLLKDKEEFSLELQKKLNSEFIEINWEKEIKENSKILELFLLLFKDNLIENEIEKQFIEVLMDNNVDFETFEIVISNNKFLVQKIKSDRRKNAPYRRKINFLNELKQLT